MPPTSAAPPDIYHLPLAGHLLCSPVVPLYKDARLSWLEFKQQISLWPGLSSELSHEVGAEEKCQAQDQEAQGAGSPSQSHLPGQHGPLAAARSMHEGSTQDPTILNQCAQGQRRIGCSAATSPLVPRVHCSVEREGADSLAARTGPSHLHRTQGTKGDVAEHKGKELSQQCRQPFC